MRPKSPGRWAGPGEVAPARLSSQPGGRSFTRHKPGVVHHFFTQLTVARSMTDSRLARLSNARGNVTTSDRGSWSCRHPISCCVREVRGPARLPVAIRHRLPAANQVVSDHGLRPRHSPVWIADPQSTFIRPIDSVLLFSRGLACGREVVVKKDPDIRRSSLRNQGFRNPHTDVSGP